uniref:Uncharacterized protein n=1 Tax=Guillardia theta TaxID=55529 RepID=A0A6U5W7P2_GUITH|mmetsp:Transcript_12554/g.43732  ORF Transcript_12554/g.43732 Transcript_12554/m.43732 type:complete len:170 (+) Transcript_12554:577-1086(+)
MTRSKLQQQSTFSSGSAMQMLPQVNVANPSQFIQSGTKSASKGSNSKPESNSDHFYHPQAIREVQEAVVEHEGRKPVGKVTIGSWAADHPKTTQSLQQGRVLDHLHKVAVVQALSAKAVVPENNIQQLVNNAGMQQVAFTDLLVCFLRRLAASSSQVTCDWLMGFRSLQ